MTCGMLTAETFEPHVGKEIRPLGQPHALRLMSVTVRPIPGWTNPTRTPFSLTLRGPRGDVLPEGFYIFNIDCGQDTEFHINPVHTPSTDYQDYQAVFT